MLVSRALFSPDQLSPAGILQTPHWSANTVNGPLLCSVSTSPAALTAATRAVIRVHRRFNNIFAREHCPLRLPSRSQTSWLLMRLHRRVKRWLRMQHGLAFSSSFLGLGSKGVAHIPNKYKRQGGNWMQGNENKFRRNVYSLSPVGRG